MIRVRFSAGLQSVDKQGLNGPCFCFQKGGLGAIAEHLQNKWGENRVTHRFKTANHRQPSLASALVSRPRLREILMAAKILAGTRSTLFGGKSRIIRIFDSNHCQMNRLFLLLFGAVSLVAHAQVPDYVPTEGLVAWYPFNGNANDESGNGNNLTSEEVIFVEDFEGNSTSAIGFPNIASKCEGSLTTPLQDFDAYSFSFWFRIDDPWSYNSFAAFAYGGSQYSILSQMAGFWWDENWYYGGCPSSDNGYRSRVRSNGISYHFEDCVNFETISQWRHIVMTFEEDTLRVYTEDEGLTAVIATTSPSTEFSGNVLRVGAHLNAPQSSLAQREVDNLGIWSRSLSESEALQILNLPASVPGCTDPTACNFDAEATSDDGSCQENDDCGICGGDNSSCAGCMDETACNFNPNALWSDGVCIYPEITWDTNSFCADSLLKAIVIVPELTENQSALSFSYGDYVRIPNSESLSSFPDGLTLECWYYQLGFSGGDEHIVGHEYFAGEGFSLENQHGTWAADIFGPDTTARWDYWDPTDINPPIANGTWSHVAMSYDGEVARYFLDGLLMDTDTASMSNLFSENFSEDLVINRHTWGGGGSSSSRLSGYLDELRISNTARYASAFEPTTVEFQNDEFTVGLYHFNEQEGSIVLDASDYENHGQCNGTSWTENTVMVGVDESVMVTWDDTPGQDSISVSFDATGSVTAEIIGDGFSCEVSSDIPTVYLILGCTDAAGCNYSPEATCDDGSCTYPPFGLSDCDEGGSLCADGTTWNSATQSCDPLPCEAAADPAACGPGTYWDELESLCLPIETCQDDLDGDGVIGVNDLMQLLSSFGTDCTPAEEPETTEFTCGDPVSYHGYDYATVEIGEQCWFAENLRTEFYQNGDSITSNLTSEEWVSTQSGAQAFYDWNDINLIEFGRLYNFSAVQDNRGVCPDNWHVPTDAEFSTLIEIVGGDTNAGELLKAATSWPVEVNGSDLFGFKALPAGSYSDGGEFSDILEKARFWSTTEVHSNAAWGRELNSSSGIFRWDNGKGNGFSVRCIKD